MPRLGWRSNDKKNGRNKNNETKLPDRLTQALKALRPGVLSHVSHLSSSFKNQESNYVATADDVVYYPSPEQYRNRQIQRLSTVTSHAAHKSPTRTNLPIQSNVESVNTFEQIQQLYRSVPNLCTIGEESPRKEESALYHSNGLRRKDPHYESLRNAVHSSSPFLDTAGSPTDSGYRSAPPTCHQQHEHFAERVHEPTTAMNCPSLETSSPQVNHYRRHPSTQDNDFQCLSREFVLTSPKDTDDNLQTKSSTTIKLRKCLESALYLLADEIRRLSLQFVKCRVLDIKTAVKVLFSDTVAGSCIKAGIQATSIYALSGSASLKTSMRRRAGLCFHLGHFYKWMIESQISEIILDEAAVFLCAVLECLLEEIILACITSGFYEGELAAADSLNKRLLDCENNVRKLLAGNNGRIMVEKEADFMTTNRPRYSDKLSSLRVNTEAQLIKLLQMKRVERNDCETVDRDNLRASYNSSTMSEWIRISEAYAMHHSSDAIDEDDVRQAARILFSVDCPPRFLSFSNSEISLKRSVKNQQKLKQEIAFQLLRVNSEEAVSMVLDFFGPARLRNLDALGLTALSEAILTGNDRAVNALILAAPDLNIPVPNEQNAKNSSTLLMDFAGWTPVTWAVAQRNYSLTVRLIDACAQVENSSMIKETPLQVAATLGDADIIRKLLKCNANPFRTTINYDSTRRNQRHVGSPSAVALAAAYNHRHILRMMLAAGINYKSSKENLSLKNFLVENEVELGKNQACLNLPSNIHSFLHLFNNEQKQALNEAMYYAAETWHIDIAMDLRKIGVGWNLHTWTTCLQAAHAQRSRDYKLLLLDDFNFRLTDELTCDNVREIATLLFDIIRSECPSPTKELRQTGAIISSFYRCMCAGRKTIIIKADNLESRSNENRKAVIDLSYVNNPDLSDITFLVNAHIPSITKKRVANKVFYGHRIVLTNASTIFRKLLDDNGNQIRLDNISYETFHVCFAR
ncbi:unnamed protein product [Litomosoides sigmodontis]|uniref:BTB domain-containing protein n=1 Tax=Litomosoides sigmodontis TaxID=42156 RepID=A0A3P6TZK2_LITSI|nr:unnamed protein product [Litomosoides sigmodontis]